MVDGFGFEGLVVSKHYIPPFQVYIFGYVFIKICRQLKGQPLEAGIFAQQNTVRVSCTYSIKTAIVISNNGNTW